ncbi:MAG: acetyl-CoA carboxylase carboxyltransferase subunit alpha [Candidatus Algichlamydia australiensis]|nr:acetyl-CoA carboxylase carboxyltransferase subunit alpha [Chlamydiales bacterium]
MLTHEKQIKECEEALERLREQNNASDVWTDEEIVRLESRLEKLKAKVYSQLSPWERVTISRHPERPQAKDYISHIVEGFEELHGDRLFRDDPAIVMGIGRIGGEKFMVIGQEKGKDTESRLHRNFGMPHPEGYRKALRAMQLAEKFNIPVLCFIDTPGAYPGLAAEERGQGWAIAKNLMEMAHLKTPVIAVLIGEGCSGGALGIGIADRVAMLEHAYYSVISPEGCASILWKDSTKQAQAAECLKLTSDDLAEYKIVDHIIDEPLGGAHYDPQVVYKAVKEYVTRENATLKQLPLETLLKERYNKFRQLGKTDHDETSFKGSS